MGTPFTPLEGVLPPPGGEVGELGFYSVVKSRWRVKPRVRAPINSNVNAPSVFVFSDSLRSPCAYLTVGVRRTRVRVTLRFTRNEYKTEVYIPSASNGASRPDREITHTHPMPDRSIARFVGSLGPMPNGATGVGVQMNRTAKS